MVTFQDTWYFALFYYFIVSKHRHKSSWGNGEEDGLDLRYILKRKGLNKSSISKYIPWDLIKAPSHLKGSYAREFQRPLYKTQNRNDQTTSNETHQDQQPTTSNDESPTLSITINLSDLAKLLNYFDGNAETFQTWEQQLTLLNTTHKLNDDTMKILIGMRLKGRALEWFHSIREQRMTWNEIINRLRDEIIKGEIEVLNKTFCKIVCDATEVTADLVNMFNELLYKTQDRNDYTTLNEMNEDHRLRRLGTTIESYLCHV
ncbi:hypothetical protein HZH66_009321 [Vespula vulgaris]|uniref:Uncharacterized protein n=1 Tax=Vespula vulgaris TaxID=7454 RepID=A0A834JSS4_VESVU|nr:hypothetical protein HZH66_009321 [Vespula vulgaris]